MTFSTPLHVGAGGKANIFEMIYVEFFSVPLAIFFTMYCDFDLIKKHRCMNVFY